MTGSIAHVDLGTQLSGDVEILPDLTQHAARRLGADETLAQRVRQTVADASARFAAAPGPRPAGRVSLELVWPVLTVVFRCASVRIIEYFDVAGILGSPAGVLASCQVLAA